VATLQMTSFALGVHTNYKNVIVMQSFAPRSGMAARVSSKKATDRFNSAHAVVRPGLAHAVNSNFNPSHVT